MIRTLLLRGAAAAALAGACMQAGMAADAPMPMPPPDGMHHMERNHEEAMKAGLAHMADRLEIKASQEGAWQKFSAAFVDMMKTVSSEPMAASPEADAASIVRARAQAAATRAQAVSRLADATTELQQVLNADQRHVLNEMARHFERMRMDSMGPGAWYRMHRMHAHEEDSCEGDGPGDMHHGMHHGDGYHGEEHHGDGADPHHAEPEMH